MPDTDSKRLVGDRMQHFAKFRCDYCDKIIKLRIDVGLKANDCGCGIAQRFYKDFLGGM
jgi:hypothetical protein